MAALIIAEGVLRVSERTNGSRVMAQSGRVSRTHQNIRLSRATRVIRDSREIRLLELVELLELY